MRLDGARGDEVINETLLSNSKLSVATSAEYSLSVLCDYYKDGEPLHVATRHDCRQIFGPGTRDMSMTTFVRLRKMCKLGL